MPTLGNALDFAKYEARNIRGHQLGSAPSSPVTGQLYYNTSDNTLYWYDGTTWQSAKGGSGSPTGAAGGDLSGTYPNPQIAAGVITDADVNAANKDGAVGTPSLRTLGSGAAQAMPGNRTLDAINSPTSSVNMNNQRLNLVGNPTLGTDAANKSYVDALASGIDAKESVKAASTGNWASFSGLGTMDGVSLSDGDRVLLKDQTAPAQNGIYQAWATGWVRTSDADSWAELPGAHVFVEQGATQADTGWVCSSDQGGTLGTTAVNWVQFSAAGQIQGGAGLLKTGNVLDVGAGAGITVNADTIQVANNGITNAMIADGAIDLASADVTNTLPLTKGGTGQTTTKTARETGLAAAGYYSSATHGAGTTISITAATHGLRASRGLIVQAQLEADGSVLIPDIVVAANGDVTVTFGVSQAANTIRVTVIG